MAQGDRLEEEDLLLDGRPARITPQTNDPQVGDNFPSLTDLEKNTILDALDRTHWIQQEAAKLLGVSKRVIHYKIKKYGITHPRWIKNR